MAIERTRRPWRGGELGREMVPLRAMMDRLFESAFTPSFWGETREGGGWFGLDVDEDDEAYYVQCQLPGINPNDIAISVQDNVVTIGGETRRTVPEGRRAVVQETSYGRFQRQVALGTPVDAGRAEAAYRDGILEITLPKTEASKPRTIQIKTAGTGR